VTRHLGPEQKNYSVPPSPSTALETPDTKTAEITQIPKTIKQRIPKYRYVQLLPFRKTWLFRKALATCNTERKSERRSVRVTTSDVVYKGDLNKMYPCDQK